MKVPFVDLVAQNKPLAPELLEALSDRINDGAFILGSEVDALEQTLGAMLEVPHAIGVSSGTDALLVSLMALGVGAGDEVVTTPFSFFATAGVIQRLDATPVFSDIGLTDYLLDPGSVAEALSSQTRAVIAVHLFGDVCDIPALRAQMQNIPLVEDAAQAIGARAPGLDPTQTGAPAGSLGALGCFSFFPTKNLGGLGDGGLVSTKDSALADRIRQLRVHGARQKYLHETAGGNFRLDALQASFLRLKLKRLSDYTSARRANALFYEDVFRSEGICTEQLGPRGLTLPVRTDGHVFNQYVVRCAQRDALKSHLLEADIGSAIYYPTPLHLQPCFSALGYREGSFPRAEQASREVLALPVSPELTPGQRDQVAETVVTFFRSQ